MHDLNDILRTQPLLKNIDKELRSLTKIQIIWQQWIASENNDNQQLNQSVLSKCFPISVRKNSLTILCEAPIIANHIRFSVPTIIQLLKNNHISTITDIQTSVSSELTKSNIESLFQNLITTKPETKKNRTVSEDTIMVLQQFQQSCSSETINESLQRLIETLNKKKVTTQSHD